MRDAFPTLRCRAGSGVAEGAREAKRRSCPGSTGIAGLAARRQCCRCGCQLVAVTCLPPVLRTPHCVRASWSPVPALRPSTATVGHLRAHSLLPSRPSTVLWSLACIFVVCAAAKSAKAWSEHLARDNGCQGVHPTDPHYPYSQNLVWWPGISTRDAVNMWVSEGGHWNYSRIPEGEDPHFEEYGHYTNVSGTPPASS